MTLGHHLSSGGRATAFQYTVAAKTANLDLHAALVAAGWSGSGDVIVTLSALVYSATQASPALVISGFATPPVVIFNSQVVGANGDKGGGGTYHHDGGNGHDGGDAISIGNDVIFDNTYGSILAGGGGGGGGAGSSFSHTPLPPADGSGGDGGRGSGAVSGGTVVSKANGKTGNAGGAPGGDGGDFGQNGHDGGDTADYNGGAKGQAGKAIKLNGNSVTWLGGFNGTQVRGAVA